MTRRLGDDDIIPGEWWQLSSDPLVEGRVRRVDRKRRIAYLKLSGGKAVAVGFDELLDCWRLSTADDGDDI